MWRLGNIGHPLVSKWRHLGIRANQLVRTQGVRFVYPSYNPIQACGLYLQTIGQSKAMMKAKDKNCRFGTEQSPHPPLPPPAPPTATSPPAAISKWSNSPTNALPKVVLVQGGDSTLQNLTDSNTTASCESNVAPPSPVYKFSTANILSRSKLNPIWSDSMFKTIFFTFHKNRLEFHPMEYI